MAYIQRSQFVFDCNQCHTRCDGVSKGLYIFDDDAKLSEQYEQMLIDHINSFTKYHAVKCTIAGYPDVAIYKHDNTLYTFAEVKVQQRTFMNVQKILPESNLHPSETVALNLSDLERYFEIRTQTNYPIIILWFLVNRLCLVKDKPLVFFQHAEALEKIYHQHKNLRRFRRKSGNGDVVEGVHKGVVVNYHFSLAELKPWMW